MVDIKQVQNTAFLSSLSKFQGGSVTCFWGPGRCPVPAHRSYGPRKNIRDGLWPASVEFTSSDLSDHWEGEIERYIHTKT